MRKQMLRLFLLAFALCLLTASAYAGTYTFPDSVKKIDDYACYDNLGLDQVILPDGIEHIGYQAFGRSSLTSIHLPDTLTFIDDTAFSGCEKLTAVSADRGTYAYDWAVRNGYISENEEPLAKPTGLKASALSCTEITASWDAVEGAAKYNVYYSTSNQTSKFTLYGEVDASTTSIVLENLEIEQKYYVKVAAVSASGLEGTKSAYKYATTDELEKPTLKVEGKTFTSVSLSWTAVDGAAGYTIYMSTSTIKSSFTACATTEADTTACTVENLASDDTYYFKVAAVAKTGEAGTQSGYKSAKLSLPAEPEDFSATADEGKVGTVHLKWTPIDGVAGYNVYMATKNLTSSYKLYKKVEGSSSEGLSIDGLEPETTYYFKVAACLANDQEGERTTYKKVTIPEAAEEAYVNLTLSQSTLTMQAGETATLTCTVDTNVVTFDPVWTSSDKTVVTVSGGQVTAVGAGSATVTCTVATNDITAEAKCEVTVQKPSLGEVKFKNYTALELYEFALADGELTIEWSCANAAYYEIKAITTDEKPVKGESQTAILTPVHETKYTGTSCTITKADVSDGEYLKFAVLAYDEAGKPADLWYWVAFKIIPEDDLTLGEVKFTDYTALELYDFNLTDGELTLEWSCRNAAYYEIKVITTDEKPVKGESQTAILTPVHDTKYTGTSCTISAEDMSDGEYLKFAVLAYDENGKPADLWYWVAFKINRKVVLPLGKVQFTNYTNYELYEYDLNDGEKTIKWSCANAAYYEIKIITTDDKPAKGVSSDTVVEIENDDHYTGTSYTLDPNTLTDGDYLKFAVHAYDQDDNPADYWYWIAFEIVGREVLPLGEVEFTTYTAFDLYEYDLSDGDKTIKWSCDNAAYYEIKVITTDDKPAKGASSATVIEFENDDYYTSSSYKVYADDLTDGDYLKVAVRAYDEDDNPADYWYWIAFEIVREDIETDYSLSVKHGTTKVYEQVPYPVWNDSASMTWTISCDGEWSAEADDTWFTVEKTSSTKLKIQIKKAYTGTTSRDGEIVFTAGSQTWTYLIHQENPVLEVKHGSEVLFDSNEDEKGYGEMGATAGAGSKYTLTVYSTHPWTLESDADWFDIDVTSSDGNENGEKVVLTLNSNVSPTEYSGTLKFKLDKYMSHEIDIVKPSDGTMDLSAKFAKIKKLFPQGKYWCHTVGEEWDAYTVSDTVCTCVYKHGKSRPGKGSHPAVDGSCGCNSFEGIQCWGYANIVGYELFGSCPVDVVGTPGDGWTKYSGASYVDSLQPGDVIRLKLGHSAVVTAVSATQITVTECNWEVNCKICWEETYTKSKMKSGGAYELAWFVRHDDMTN